MDDPFLSMPLGELTQVLSDIRVEISRQRETDALWEETGDRVAMRLRLELRILHAILERDENLGDFRKARNLMFLE